jgi:hypothetical protein
VPEQSLIHLKRRTLPTPTATMPDHPAADSPKAIGLALLTRAESSGKQVLLYEPQGVLGGTFTCARCQAAALQPDLMTHSADCGYASGPRRNPITGG